MFVERFLTKLSLLLRGTTVAPAARFGETLDEERTKGGSFFAPYDAPAGTPASTPRNSGLPNGDLRLYGGAQFNRAMAEFRYHLFVHISLSCSCWCHVLEFVAWRRFRN